MIIVFTLQGSNLSMVIVLPDERMGLAEVEKKLAGVEFKNLTKSRPVEVEVSLPRFKLEYSQNLVEILSEVSRTKHSFLYLKLLFKALMHS